MSELDPRTILAPVEPVTPAASLPAVRLGFTERTKQFVFDLMRVRRGTLVADIGATTRKHTEGGGDSDTIGMLKRGATVYSINIDQKELAKLGHEAAERGTMIPVLNSVRSIQPEDGKSRIPDGSLDAALISMCLHHFSDPDSMLRSIYDALKPGARIVIFDRQFANPGTCDTQAKQDENHCLEPSAVAEMLQRNGFKLLSKDAFARMHPIFTFVDNKVTRAWPYVVVAEKELEQPPLLRTELASRK